MPPVPNLLCETLVIPRHTEVIARVKLANGTDSVPRVIEPNACYCERSECMVFRCLINGDEGAVLLRNLTEDTVTVRKNTHVVIACVCTVVNCVTDYGPVSEDLD